MENFSTQSTTTILFSADRIEYFMKIENYFSKFCKKLHLEFTVNNNLVELRSTEKMDDPINFINGKDILYLLNRGVKFESAVQILEENKSYCVVNIYMRDKKIFNNRRARLVKNGVEKAIKKITGCDMFIYGKTVSLIGPYDGLRDGEFLIKKTMDNIHPLNILKQIVAKKELFNRKELKEEDWKDLLPSLRKRYK